jgi:hypothetical protein
MDLSKAIMELQSEKARIEQAIALLEGMIHKEQAEKNQQTAPIKRRGRPGRKSMGAEERQQVAARMKTYWENRRNKVES